MKEAKVLLKIIKNFMEDSKCPTTGEIAEDKLYQLAKKHKVENFLKTWAETSCESETIKKWILDHYYTQIIKDTNENIELDQILNTLEKAKIATFIVKGVTMKEVYPKDYMRQMCDIDLLLDRKDFKIATQKLEELGFHKYYDHEKHLVFEKKPFILIELHRKLLSEEKTGSQYFNHIWSFGVPYQNYHHIYRMSLEDTYVFCIIHLMHHFQVTGIKIRDILDVYWINEMYKNSFDLEKVNKKLEELKIKEFEKKIKQIAYRWFGTNEIQDFDEIETFLLKGETTENQVHYEVGKNNGKFNYILNMFFPKYERMQQNYPILKKFPILLPIMWILRMIKKVFAKETTIKERIQKIKLVRNVKKEDVQHMNEIYKKLGL